MVLRSLLRSSKGKGNMEIPEQSSSLHLSQYFLDVADIVAFQFLAIFRTVLIEKSLEFFAARSSLVIPFTTPFESIAHRKLQSFQNGSKELSVNIQGSQK
jgi:hypothetical protein